MRTRPSPDAIRGSWYFLPLSADPHNPDRPILTYRFRLDGTFSIYGARGDESFEKEKGDYTFDGAFLIMRGRNTETYRVKVKDAWRWVLEGKKDEYALLRGRITDNDFVELTADQQKEIRILPIRVTVDNFSNNRDGIYDLIYKSGGTTRTVGALFVEKDAEQGKLWVGLSPCTPGIEAKSWERIVRDSFLDIHLGKPKDVRVVTVRNLINGESKVFTY